MEMPSKGMYNYDPELGAQYAQSYALYFSLPEQLKLFYYDPNGNDCANFVSQCIWASYGGWIPGMDTGTTAENKSRILANVRQVGGIWHGSASNGGTTIWQRVNDLYNYIVSNNNLGPRGDNVAEGTWDMVDPRMIRQGDIVQMVVTAYSGNSFGHGLYVTKPGYDWYDILVCSHSRDRLNSQISEFSQNPAGYPRLRVLRMRPANFAK